MILKKLYDRCVELARHKFSKPLLGFVAFIESFFFPVPPDLMIVPMVVAKREDYLKIFLIATTGSVLGGLFGYMLGVFFLDASMVIIEFYGYEEKVFEIQKIFSKKKEIDFIQNLPFIITPDKDSKESWDSKPYDQA